MVNKYAAICAICTAPVPPGGGTMQRQGRRWRVTHLACDDTGDPVVIRVRVGGNPRVYTRNARGRCEDAPCCGCCTV